MVFASSDVFRAAREVQSQSFGCMTPRTGQSWTKNGKFWVCSSGSCRQWTYCDKLQCHDCGAEAPKWVREQAGSTAPATGGGGPRTSTLGEWQVTQPKRQKRKEKRAAAAAAKAAAVAKAAEEPEGTDGSDTGHSSSSVRTSYAPWTKEQLEATAEALRSLAHKPASVAAEIEAIEGELAKREKPISVPVPLHTLERKAHERERKLARKVAAIEGQLQEATKEKERAVCAEQQKAKELAEARQEHQEAAQEVSKAKVLVAAEAHPDEVVAAVSKADLSQPEVRQVATLFQVMLKEAARMAETRTSFLASHGLQAMPDLQTVAPEDAHLVRNLQEMENQLGKFGQRVVADFTTAQGRQAEALAGLVDHQSRRAIAAATPPAGAAAPPPAAGTAAAPSAAPAMPAAPAETVASAPAAVVVAPTAAAAGHAGAGDAAMGMSSG